MRTAALIALACALGACNTSDVSRALGAICEANDECDERCLLPSAEFPDGFCTISCDTHADCRAGSRCVAIDGGICLFECIDDESCAFLGDDWVCRMLDSNTDGQVSVCHGNS